MSNFQPPSSTTWSSLSNRYNLANGEAYTLPPIKLAFEKYIFRQIDGLISTRKHPLDVLILACGTGVEVDVLTDRYDKSQLRILATDFADGMVKCTEELITKKGKQEMVEVKQMDACDITLENSTMDIVILFFGPMLLPDPDRGLSEILRVLRPDGFSAYMTTHELDQYDTWDEAKKLVVEARDSALSEEQRWQGILYKSFYEHPVMINWGKTENVVKRVSQAGFKNPEGRVIEATTDLRAGDDLNHYIASISANPGISMFQVTFTDDEKQAFYSHVIRLMKERWPGPLMQMRFAVNLVWGFKA